MPERVAYAEERLEALKARIALLDIRLHDETGTAEVFRDGERAAVGTTIPVEPGQHVIEVRSGDGATRRYEVALAPGDHRRLEVEPEPVEPGPAPNAPPPARTNPPADPVRPAHSSSADPMPSRVAGWALVGLGVTGLAVSGVAAGFVLDKKATVEGECSSDLVCSPAGKRAADAGKTWAAVGTVAFIAGGAAGVAGTYLLLSGRTDGKAASVSVAGTF
jgi:hypothetical protein